VIEVFGADEQRDVAVDVLRFTRLARLVVEEERVPGDAELSLIFVDAQTMTDLNVRFHEGSGPTDVLAFPMDDDIVVAGRQPDQGGRGPGAPAEAGEPPAVIGDVIVCPSVAAHQAPEHGSTTDEELALLVVHGVLHLLEYNHEEPEETATMQRRERELLARFAEVERFTPDDQGAT
jgi:probable rRNA maturation factor